MRNMLTIVVVLSPLLVGCGSGLINGAHESCLGTSSKSFVATWDCVRQETTGKRKDDLQMAYIAAGDALAEQVRAGRMTDAQARSALSDRLVKINNEGQMRNTRRGGLVCNHIGNTTICN